jgi:hypothetical protein
MEVLSNVGGASWNTSSIWENLDEMNSNSGQQRSAEEQERQE